MSEVLTFIVGIALIIIVLKFIKGIIKFVLSVALAAVIVGVCFYLTSGGSINSLKQGTERYTEITELVNENKDKVKLENGNVMLNINNKWYNATELNKIKKTKNGYSAVINGETIEITDKDISDALNILL